ncbi:MAG: hypothetical protein KGJ59_02730 [Bacteroidota bacterium]|nr:hypothetical protein [Bacteroidota bacterium]
MIKNFITRVASVLARTQMAGPTLSSAVDVCRRAAAHGWKITLGLWERPFDTPALVAFQYARALDALASVNADCRLSIKLTALQHSSTLLSDVVWRAKAFDVPLHIDAQHPESAPYAFALLEFGLQRYRNIGYTLPARWQRSIADAEKILDMQIPVRIVKGQWHDPSGPSSDVRRRYLDLVGMFAGSKNYVSIATHDWKLAREAVRKLAEQGTPCEIEQLAGLPWLNTRAEDVEKISRRLFIPYGHPSMPYNFSISFVREHPKILWWALRDSLLTFNEKIYRLGPAPLASTPPPSSGTRSYIAAQ